ncbi:MAG: helix-turn-helix transcriptional regulator [Phycisphaerales bacterium]|nr:helix-turn-helix transcriptional regulator [Phycisphaerales bacterium]
MIGAEESISRKWTLPLLCVLGSSPARFGQIKAALAPRGATDRALSLTLRALRDDRLVTRRVIHESPPGVLYRLADRALPLATAVAYL